MRWLDGEAAQAALVQDWFKAELSLALMQASAAIASAAFVQWFAFLRVRPD